jgi:hypothetical protein
MQQKPRRNWAIEKYPESRKMKSQEIVKTDRMGVVWRGTTVLIPILAQILKCGTY